MPHSPVCSRSTWTYVSCASGCSLSRPTTLLPSPCCPGTARQHSTWHSHSHSRRYEASQLAWAPLLKEAERGCGTASQEWAGLLCLSTAELMQFCTSKHQHVCTVSLSHLSHTATRAQTQHCTLHPSAFAGHPPVRTFRSRKTALRSRICQVVSAHDVACAVLNKPNQHGQPVLLPAAVGHHRRHASTQPMTAHISHTPTLCVLCSHRVAWVHVKVFIC